MKNLRNYNIYFHLHTISGIFACLLLYVIFFAGTFSFFKQEITAWQNNASYAAYRHIAVPVDYIIDSLSAIKNLKGRDIDFYFVRNATETYVNVSASSDTTITDKNTRTTQKRGRRGGADRINFKYNYLKNSSGSYEDTYDMGEFLYRLHFLAQLNQIPIRLGHPFGYMLAGIVSFLFLFALITGILLHWDKIISNFFTFRPWTKLKTLWTDAHTALGVIGFPYQFMFAVTGLFLIVNVVLVSPFSKLLYKSHEEELYSDIGVRTNASYTYTYDSLPQKIVMAPYLNDVKKKWPEATLKSVQIINYGDKSMHMVIEADADRKKSFAATGKIVYEAATGKVVDYVSVTDKPGYVQKVRALLYRLHFGDYGGYPLKIIYFILGIMGCVVIISGILIWYVARDKKSTAPHKHKFNYWITNIFLSICLTMFPVTVITFIAVKLSGIPGQSFIYKVYFYTWLCLSALYVIRRNIQKTNKETLLLGGVLCFFIPVADGITTGNWIWRSWNTGASDILIFNLLWIFIGTIALISFIKIKDHERKQMLN
ncbi:PepSY-associated TM helix domain-containing protein [Haoranjiania flava]|uniref:PepSY domain-containing protein n=1 Tax=Haoranjiania flava TaxID=1856322 RepID=A0AAE3IR64_9BACT|nr:PepSY-associated TM helix domain-containing protein [Haoranjiania flava]MCU7695573.1 PepSY domain-containing protein [Haoranjiania flava]